MLPEDLSKQVAACRGIRSGLRAYQRELASLWVQGRELERDATDKERAETLARLEELQAAFETALQRTTQRLAGLEKALTSRRYFQVDLDKTCRWLRRADAITFLEIDFSGVDEGSGLQTQLSNFQTVLEQASEYENLLLIVQRIGQEILPTMNETDHCYLDERLNALPQQYNAILALAKEKKDRVQQIIMERKEFSTFFDITRNALQELQEQSDNLEKQTISGREEDFVCLMNKYRSIDESLVHISPAVRELHGKNEGFLIRGQKYRAEETQQLVVLHNTLKRRNNQKVEHLKGCLEKLTEHNRAVSRLRSTIKSVNEALLDVKSNKDSRTSEKITDLYSLLQSLDEARSQVEESYKEAKYLNLKFDAAAFQETTLHLESFRSLQRNVQSVIRQSEAETKNTDDLTGEAESMLDWLKMLKDKLKEPLVFSEVKTEWTLRERQKLGIMEEEVESASRATDLLSVKTKLEYESRKESVPAHVEEKLQELMSLGAEVQQEIRAKRVKKKFSSQ